MKIATVIFAFIAASSSPASSFAEDSSRGTAIAAIRTPTQIVVAADSKEVSFSGTSLSDEICKIRQAGPVFYAVHGLSRDIRTGFNVFNMIEAGNKPGSTIKDLADTFERSAREPLQQIAERVRNYDRDQFRSNFIDSDPLGVLFFGIENGEVTVSYRRFVISTAPSLPVALTVQRYDCPGPSCTRATTIDIFVGTEAAAFKRDNPDYLKKDLIEAVRSYIQFSIDRHGDAYGPPIDIIRLTRDGAEWVQRKGSCP